MSSEGGHSIGDETFVPIHLLSPQGLEAFLHARGDDFAAAARAASFSGRAGQLARILGADGAARAVLVGLGDSSRPDMAALRALPSRLPAADYRIADPDPALDWNRLVLGWSLGAYRFQRYKTGAAEPAARLLPPDGADVRRGAILADACALARDLINTPANDLGPAELEQAARTVAERRGATLTVTTGDALLEAGYPAVHAVGRAAVTARAPRMLEMTWGDAAHPLIAIVGKGVVFDSGGLDIKPSAGMRWMKKDMGGAAHALALADAVMAAGLPARLVLLIPAVENAISGDAMRPGDVLASRKGLTIEVGNTDAEGRLVLADALARAAELTPALTIDLATLTGAARVALGPEVIPFYTDDEALAAELAAASRSEEDPLWRMPLWDGYAGALDSDIADIKNDPDAWAQAGSVTAALFLRRFAPAAPWVHLDIFAWSGKTRPGYPAGAEAQGLRALFAVIEARCR